MHELWRKAIANPSHMLEFIASLSQAVDPTLLDPPSAPRRSSSRNSTPQQNGPPQNAFLSPPPRRDASYTAANIMHLPRRVSSRDALRNEDAQREMEMEQQLRDVAAVADYEVRRALLVSAPQQEQRSTRQDEPGRQEEQRAIAQSERRALVSRQLDDVVELVKVLAPEEWAASAPVSRQALDTSTLCTFLRGLQRIAASGRGSGLKFAGLRRFKELYADFLERHAVEGPTVPAIEYLSDHRQNPQIRSRAARRPTWLPELIQTHAELVRQTDDTVDSID